MIQFPHSPQRDDKGRVISAVDWLGNRFHVGDHVLYSIHHGDTHMMALGEVLQIKAVMRPAKKYRDPEPGEQPDFVNDLADPPIGLVKYTTFYDEVTVRVRTLRTADPYCKGERKGGAWVNPNNITKAQI